jgi:hypothetical protein
LTGVADVDEFVIAADGGSVDGVTAVSLGLFPWWPFCIGDGLEGALCSPVTAMTLGRGSSGRTLGALPTRNASSIAASRFARASATSRSAARAARRCNFKLLLLGLAAADSEGPGDPVDVVFFGATSGAVTWRFIDDRNRVRMK